jgi:hypothetical protein
MKPLKRFYNLLELDKKDVYQLFFYGIVSVISLSYHPSHYELYTIRKSKCFLIVLIVLVVLSSTSWCSIFDAITNYGKFTTKNLIRSSFEFAVRLPKIKFEEYYNTYPLNLLTAF